MTRARPRPIATIGARVAFLIVAVTVGGCASAPDPSQWPSASGHAPSSIAGSATPMAQPAQPTASGTGIPDLIRWCDITRADGSRAPTGGHPSMLPEGLDVIPIPDGDVIYATYFEPWSSHPTLYAVGPRGARCGVDVGTGFLWWIGGPSGFAFSYEESWSVDPPRWMGCPYLSSARQASAADPGRSGEAEASVSCIRDPSDQVVPIPAEGPGLELAIVSTESPRELGPTLQLYGYRPDDAPGGQLGFTAKCPFDVERAARCRAALAFAAWSVGGGTSAVDAILGAVLVPPET